VPRQARAEDVQVGRIPILGVATHRGSVATKDQRFVNGFFEVLQNQLTQKTHYFFVKRPGLAAYVDHSVTAEGRAAFSWNGALYTAVGNKLYKNGVDLGATLNNSTGISNFAALRPQAASPRLCFTDGVDLWTITTGDAVVQITACPSNVGDLVYFDGYLVILNNSGEIQNCDLDDPATWNGTKVLSAIMAGGTQVALARMEDFLIVFQDNCFQTFYDNANASGSPFKNYEQGYKQIGCRSRTSVASDESLVIWVGAGPKMAPSVWMMTDPGQPQEIADHKVKQLLALEGTTLSTSIGNLIRIAGHHFYTLNLPTLGRTLIYDVTTQLWFEWQGAGGSGVFPISRYASHSEVLRALHLSNGKIYSLQESTYQDDSANFTVLARLSREDLGTLARKFIQYLSLLGDVQATTTNVALEYSDNDWVTTSSTSRVFNQAENYPTQTRLGSFRRRSWQLSYSGANPVRWEGLEIRYRMGEI
jgi:hypothetical protein